MLFPISDLRAIANNSTRSNDGLTLIMSSSDGFCSSLLFAPGELGQQYTAPASATTTHQTGTSVSSINQTSLPTPTHPISSPSTTTSTPAISTTAQPSATQIVPPTSPARSTSASSNNTPSLSQQPASVVNNPTPTLGSVPLVTAANSAQPSPFPLTTPPQTPLSAVSQSGSNSNSVLGKRDVSETGKEENQDSQSQDPSSSSSTQQQQPKKRRVAPTLVSSSGSGSAGDSSTN